MNPIVSTLIKGMLYFILKAKQGGKYLDRKRVVDKKTGKMVWGNYKYKPMQQRAAHEVTRGKFEKVTKLSGDEHKNQIEHALQNGIHVSLHVLRDYPDLAVKYHQQARLAKADKIRAKVKASKAELSKPSIKQIKESSQVSTPSTENKGSEEKKMELGYFDYKEIIGDKFGEHPNVAEKILHFFKGSTKSTGVDGIIKLIRHSPEKMLMLMDSMIEKGVTSKYVNSQTLHENDKQAMIKIIESMKLQKVKLTSGSDKQLKWATDLAKKAMQYINDKYIKEKLVNNLEENGDGKYDKIISLLQSKHDAKWWIDWARDFSLLERSLKKVGLDSNFYKE